MQSPLRQCQGFVARAVWIEEEGKTKPFQEKEET